MGSPQTIFTAARIPPDLMEQATERAREIGKQSDVPRSGVIRFSLALLAGEPVSEALRHLSAREDAISARQHHK